MTDGDQVPDIPLSDTGGKVGGVVPAQNATILEKVGVKTGLVNIVPMKRSVVHPLIVNEKLE